MFKMEKQGQDGQGGLNADWDLIWKKRMPLAALWLQCLIWTESDKVHAGELQNRILAFTEEPEAAGEKIEWCGKEKHTNYLSYTGIALRKQTVDATDSSTNPSCNKWPAVLGKALEKYGMSWFERSNWSQMSQLELSHMYCLIRFEMSRTFRNARSTSWPSILGTSWHIVRTIWTMGIKRGTTHQRHPRARHQHFEIFRCFGSVSISDVRFCFFRFGGASPFQRLGASAPWLLCGPWAPQPLQGYDMKQIKINKITQQMSFNNIIYYIILWYTM